MNSHYTFEDRTRIVFVIARRVLPEEERHQIGHAGEHVPLTDISSYPSFVYDEDTAQWGITARGKKVGVPVWWFDDEATARMAWELTT